MPWPLGVKGSSLAVIGIQYAPLEAETKFEDSKMMSARRDCNSFIFSGLAITVTRV